MIKNLYWLPAGQLTLDTSALNQHLEPGKQVTLQIWSYLLDTKEGPIIIDTGMPDSFMENPDYFKNTPVEGQFIPLMKKQDHIVPLLKKIGYEPTDIQAIICSHMHMDHAGGNPYFPKTPIYVQETELDAALGNAGYAPPECLDPSLNYQKLNGDYELTAGVNILYTPGHSPGHQSILVNTEKTGNILLTIDLAYTRENYEEEIPFATFDQELASQSIKKIKNLMTEYKPAKIFYGHDLEQAKVQKGYPYGY